jgi:hypothetical protein
MHSETADVNTRQNDRIRKHSSSRMNEKIDKNIYESVRQYLKADRQLILDRLRDLDREWDIDRAIVANLSVISIAGLTAGVLLSRKWLYLTMSQIPLLLWHSVALWSPPSMVMRQLGFRSRLEIEIEKRALIDLLDRGVMLQETTDDNCTLYGT